MTVIVRQPLEVFADYHQFYVQDGGVNPPAPEAWTDQDISNRCKVAENVVVVCPLRNMNVAVEVVVHDSAPAPEPSRQPDHVVECSLHLPSGHLQIHECTGGGVFDTHVEPGTYVARLSYFGLDSVSDNGLEGNDSYRVDLWPGQEQSLKVTRYWSAANEA